MIILCFNSGLETKTKLLIKNHQVGKKTSLGTIEQIICDEIIDLRIRKMKVSRKYISDRAVALSKEFNIKLKATGNWITGFMKKNGFTLR